MTESKVGVAVVGTGYWGINHVRTMANLSSAQLLYACDSNADALARVASIAPDAARTAHLDDVLADDAVEAVVLATPARDHAAQAIAVLEAGRHVLIEKPMALSLADARRVAAAAKAADRIVVVGHLLIYHAAVQRLRTMLDSGELGELFYLHSDRVNLGRLRTDENALWSFAPHDFSIIDYLIDGEPESVTARGECYLQEGIEDVVFVNIRYADGRMANVHLSWIHPRKERRVTLVCSQKMVEFDDVSTEKLRIYDKGYDRPPNFTRYDEYLTIRQGDVHIPHLKMVEPLATECRHFIKCVQTGETPATDIASGLRVVRMLEAAQQSLDQGGKTIAF